MWLPICAAQVETHAACRAGVNLRRVAWIMDSL